MFAPPGCRRRWRHNAFRSARSDEDGCDRADIAASGASNQTGDVRAAAAGGDGGTTLFVPPGPTKTAATERTSQRVERAIKQAMFAPPGCRRRWRHNAFRSARSDEGGCDRADIAASGASNQTGDVRAAGLQEEMAAQRFSFAIRRRRLRPSGHRSERGEQSNRRCSRRRAAGGDGGTTLFRSARSDEDGCDRADIAASGASDQTAPVFSATTSNSLTMRLAISKEAVAAGDGAFSTCTWRGARW